MSTAVCSGITCPNGNCIGCRNGTLWCSDPRCAPNCPGCPTNSNVWSVVVIVAVVVIGLVIIAAVVLAYYHASRPATITPISPVIGDNVAYSPGQTIIQ